MQRSELNKWDYRKCHELLLQEKGCSNEWFAVDKFGNCLCVSLNSECKEDERIWVPTLFGHGQRDGNGKYEAGLPGLYFNSNGGEYIVKGCKPVTCDGSRIDGARLGHSNVPLSTLSSGFKATLQKFGSVKSDSSRVSLI